MRTMFDRDHRAYTSECPVVMRKTASELKPWPVLVVMGQGWSVPRKERPRPAGNQCGRFVLSYFLPFTHEWSALHPQQQR